MNDYEQEMADEIRMRVWSGFHHLPDVLEMIKDIDEGDADQQMLAAFAESEFQAKRDAEATWPAVTDFERLDAAFDALNERDIIAIHYAGSSMSDGLRVLDEELEQSGRSNASGYCFYHAQDVARALDGCGLFLAYGDLAGTSEWNRAIGKIVKEELERQGFLVEWDGDENKRIDLPGMVWQHRTV